MADLTERLNQQIEENVQLNRECRKLRTTIREYLVETNAARKVFTDAACYFFSLDHNPELLLEHLTDRHKTARLAREEKDRIKSIVKEIMAEEKGEVNPNVSKTIFNYEEKK